MAAPVSKMITCNRLRDGEVLYWKNGIWVTDLQQGEVFADEASAEAALALVQKDIAENRVVAAYIFDVRLEKDHIQPVKERELVRAAGPTVRPDTGKQAAPGAERPKGQIHV
jgi:hypothetical protein